MFRYLTAPFFLGILSLCYGQHDDSSNQTNDFELLLGHWEVTWTYSPGTDQERTLTGTLFCSKCLNESYIKCTYQMLKPDGRKALNEVYYNFNSIYGTYESLWLSSTWPVKVLMNGTLHRNEDHVNGYFKAEFPIENGEMEYVRDEMEFNIGRSVTRKTFIRTTKSENWRHHMTEKLQRSTK